MDGAAPSTTSALDTCQYEKVNLSGLSELSISAAACWCVLRSRNVSHFHRVLDFLNAIYRATPDLLHFRHYAKLSLGLRAETILDLVDRNGTTAETWEVFQQLFPDNPLDVAPHATHRDLEKVLAANSSFQNLVNNLFKDEQYRMCYMKVHLDFGEPFVAVLEKLFRELLARLATALPENRRQELTCILETYSVGTQSCFKDNKSLEVF
ncbi:TERF1-interacting nuclear factor 2 isoform X2 [Pseudophryne corroboree]|uniref:TERF1-interacting nuclear factor 2 isoform X2 n=1 Tax=Pseudophryne corroboree TaxID=495146 RepID=UPI0030817314